MAKASGEGSKHRTSDELKALYAAKGAGGYCNPPESGKFRAGDGRKRGGPRKRIALVARAPAHMDDVTEDVLNTLVTLKDRSTGKPKRVSALRAVLMKEMADALGGDAKARQSFLARAAKLQKVKDDEQSIIVGRVVQFISDTNAGRFWILNDFTRDLLIESAQQSGKLELLAKLVDALRLHDESEASDRPKRAEVSPRVPSDQADRRGAS